jgi:hypothetical protein
MLMKKPRYRIFDYPARFYKPDQDSHEKLKKKLGFQSYRKFKYRKKNPIVWIVLIILVIFLIIKFSGR